jgi:flagellar operon protein
MTAQNVFTAGYPQSVQPARPGGASAARGAGGASATASPGGVSFAEVLRNKVGGLKFSAHAAARMSSRNIGMTPELMNKLENAVSGAASKGSRDSLILMKNCAFIVNVPNRTVVTAMDGESMQSNIFTNIDSAIIAD